MYISLFFYLDCKDISLGDVLQFMTGANCVPAVGFAFTPEDKLPVVSTCALSITFPRCISQMTYGKFNG